MKPFSALYYIKNNRGRAFVIIFMLFFTTAMLIAGNYIMSNFWFWEKISDYTDKNVVVGVVSNDEDFKDYNSFVKDLKSDDRLVVMDRSGLGFGGMQWNCTMGWQMGSSSMVFNSVDDLKTAFEYFGIDCDFTDVKNRSIVISKAYAANLGYKKGDVIPAGEVSSVTKGDFTIDALIDDDSFIFFYVFENPENLVRCNVIGKDMEGQELYDYINNLKGDRRVNVDARARTETASQLGSFKAIFTIGAILLSVIIAVTTNSVITGQYIKRRFEFGIYRALGISKRRIKNKCAAEILTMDMIALVIGGIVTLLATFMLNQLVYLPKGEYLPYFTGFAGIVMAISNLLVIVPMILLKGRQMSRVDVTEF